MFSVIGPNQINFDEMINNPDILPKACNDIFGNDTVTTQQQYYQQQPTNIYIPATYITVATTTATITNSRGVG